MFYRGVYGIWWLGTVAIRLHGSLIGFRAWGIPKVTPAGIMSYFEVFMFRV